MLSFILLSCHDESQLSDAERIEIIGAVKKTASQLFIELDSNKIDNAMKYIDSTATFKYIGFFIGTIKREDILNAYRSGHKRGVSLMSQWVNIEVDPLTNQLAYFQGHFNLIETDSLREDHKTYGYISSIITLNNKNWKYLKGQIFMKDIKSPTNKDRL